jgi:hypothetical protein
MTRSRYIKMLQMIVENVTQRVTHIGAEGERELELRPLKSVCCRYQDLMNLRAFYTREAAALAGRIERQQKVQSQQQRKGIKTKLHALRAGTLPSASQIQLMGAFDGIVIESKQEGLEQEHDDNYYIQMFNSVDTDGSGAIDREELSRAVRQAGQGAYGDRARRGDAGDGY